jgi:hypothetical protein
MIILDLVVPEGWSGFVRQAETCRSVVALGSPRESRRLFVCSVRELIPPLAFV